jgi:hypothetical protein
MKRFWETTKYLNITLSSTFFHKNNGKQVKFFFIKEERAKSLMQSCINMMMILASELVD